MRFRMRRSIIRVSQNRPSVKRRSDGDRTFPSCPACCSGSGNGELHRPRYYSSPTETTLPHINPDLIKEPWRASYPAHTKALYTWGSLSGSREKTSPVDLSAHAWVFYNVRFLLVCELAGAWARFGGISAQLAHLGLIANMDVVENANIAMT